ncbi:MAG TPA: 16S rRNA (guanine(966)-N(2))-methyltransferase RsmD [Deltaproteobacteria bacterium]|nr:16S rRNA (guanine(966)-N(2))-methyltransferase RsmD [Deltaproteobacteria bacterium]
MRITGGSLRGRRLASPARGVRPTSDKVRQALFNILAGRTSEARVLDLFAGSGAMGIEALSRGARCAVFVDISKPALDTVRKNLARCGLADRARVLAKPAAAAIAGLERLGERFDLVIVDPPYHAGLMEGTLKALADSSILADGALVAAETWRHRPVETGPEGLVEVDRRRYGDTVIHLFRKTGP